MFNSGLRPLACWDLGFESHRKHGCLYVAIVVCCQAEVSVTDWSLAQRSRTDCGTSLRGCVWSRNLELRTLKPATGLWKIQPQWVVTSGKQTNICLIHKSLIFYIVIWIF